MNEPNFKQIILIGSPSRKQDNLLVLLESMEESISVQCVDTCQQAETMIKPNLNTLALIDYRHPEECIKKEISTFIKNQPDIQIVLLGSRPVQKTVLSDLTVSEITYDDVSVGVLQHLFFDASL